MTSRPDRPEYTPYSQFDPRAYLAEYHAGVIEDERLCLEFLLESLRRLPDCDVAVDFGCGPLISHLLPLAEKAAEVHAAEYLAANRAEVERWLAGAPDAYEWREFTLEILRLSGRAATATAAEELERATRARTTRVLPCDLHLPDPLGPERRAAYPLVTSHYCAEGISPDKQGWRTRMSHLASLVAPGGSLILTSCGSLRGRSMGDFYRVGGRFYPLTTVSPSDLAESLADNGFVDMDLRVRKLSNPGHQGYDCLLFACARRGR
jgi:hypothetical protein